MKETKYGVHYFEKKIIGHTEAKDGKEPEPIMRGEFKIKYLDDSLEKAKGLYNEFSKENMKNEMINHTNFFEREEKIGNNKIVYIKYLEVGK